MILHKDLEIYPYKPSFVQQLKDTDYEQRKIFTRDMLWLYGEKQQNWLQGMLGPLDLPTYLLVTAFHGAPRSHECTKQNLELCKI